MLIFIDIESTGLQESDTLCSVAILYEKNSMYELANEGKSIASEASSVHHITNEMLCDVLAFDKGEIYEFLKKHNTKEHTLVCYAAEYTRVMLASGGLFWKGALIDVQRVTKHKFPQFSSYALQLLRYELGLYKEEESLKESYGIKDATVAHNALGDALIVELLYKYLHESVSEQEMLVLSEKNVLLEKFHFGKHKGKSVEDVSMSDPSYMDWLLHNSQDLDEDMRYTLNYYLQGKI